MPDRWFAPWGAAGKPLGAIFNFTLVLAHRPDSMQGSPMSYPMLRPATQFPPTSHATNHVAGGCWDMPRDRWERKQ